MISVDEALRVVTRAFVATEHEVLPLSDALGSFAAAPILARGDFPAFDQSAMDGYAVRADDLAHASPGTPVRLAVIGEARAGAAGATAAEALRPGTAARIFTGAVVPPGADAVVMQEQVERRDKSAEFLAPIRPGDHIRKTASDTARGDVIVTAHQRIGPGEIGLLASQRIGEVAVFRRPRVAIVTTGDELRAMEAPASPGTIVNSNAYSLAAHIRETGCNPVVLPSAADTDEAIVSSLRTALASADVVLTVGGVSVGDHDHVHAALAALGITPLFSKVAMKPGKPLTFAMHGAQPVIGLPGNPVSASVAFEVFVKPGLRRLCGDPTPFPELRTVRIAAPLQRTTGRMEFARARIETEPTGPVAHLHARQNSGSLRSLTAIQALVVIPAEMEIVPAGAELSAILLGDPGRCSEPAPFAARV